MFVLQQLLLLLQNDIHESHGFVSIIARGTTIHVPSTGCSCCISLLASILVVLFVLEQNCENTFL